MAKSETGQRVIEMIVAHRERFEAFCRSLSEEELSRPVPDSTWVVKDFVSHLATLDPGIAVSIESAVSGRPETSGPMSDLDAYNEGLVTERREWPLERILEEARANRAKLIAVLEGLTEEEVGRTVHFMGDAKRSPADLPLKVFLLGWARHDPIHAVDMLRALPERQGDAELAAWTDDPVIKGYQIAMSGPPRR
jgi:hypothetical protein